MYWESYNKLFWGMILIVFNFNIGPFDILPNFIGYLLIYSGLERLAEQESVYKKGAVPALIMAVVSFIEIFKPLAAAPTGEFAIDINLWFTPATALTSMLAMYVNYIICRGIYLLSERRGVDELRIDSSGRYKFYFVINAIFLFYMPFSLNLPKNIGSFMIIAVVLNIISAVLLIGLYRRSREFLKD